MIIASQNYTRLFNGSELNIVSSVLYLAADDDKFERMMTTHMYVHILRLFLNKNCCKTQ